MSNTTKANVLKIAPELSTVTDDDLWTMVLNDVVELVPYNVYGTKQEMAQRYLTAHLLTLSSGSGSGSTSGSGLVKRVKNGNVEVEYQEISSDISNFDRYDMTKYGQRFNQIAQMVRTTFIGVIN